MVDLTPLDRLTRKRNSLLQKQLDVQLQIMNEEYRMTKKHLEKNTKDVGDFLMGVQHTAPGLSSYGQPDTRAMNAKNLLMERRFHDDERGREEDESKGRKSSGHRGGKAKKKGGTAAVSEDSEKENSSKPPPAPSSRNEFFNRKIVLDSRRRSFLQHCLSHSGLITGISGLAKSKEARTGAPTPNTDVGREGAVSASGFLSNRGTAGETSHTPARRAHSALGHPVHSARYGKEAYSNEEEKLHDHIMGRFEVIFDPQNEKPQGRIGRNTPAATPIIVATDVTDARPSDQNQTTPHSSSSYIMNRRVAWSAPPKRHESPITAVAATNKAAYQGGRSPKGPLPPRPHSIQVMATQDPSERRAGGGGRIVSASPRHRPLTRPKTAPVSHDKYDLLQRTMSAPRQQVAGILADIQSRRADTRAMLSKSRQLKNMVKQLAPDPVQSLDDSFSD